MTSKNEIITSPITAEEIAQIENIELLFFAYRDFIADPDRILADYSFGRAHHRALYFINRNPGMTVAELLGILNITKQSLSRVLRELIDSDYISQTAGANDKRKRLIYPTHKGRDLVLALSFPQSERISKALENLDEDGANQVKQFLRLMIDKTG